MPCASLQRRHHCLSWMACLAAIASGLTAAEPAVSADHAEKMQRGLTLFEAKVSQLLKARCLECHAGSTLEGSLDLSTRAGLLKGGERGPAVVAGRGVDSLLTKLVRRSQEPHMPAEDKPLSEDECQWLSDWIDCGAPYSASLGPVKVADDDWTRRTISPQDKQHWAFQPLQPQEVPGRRASALRNAVDAFLQSAREEHGVTSSPPADRRTQIRRVTLDLLGVPPTAEEVEAFEADSSPDAYQRLIDRLLTDPRYGERYARHWLDLVRFAESHGFEHDYDRPTAYHYRDFVVQALNENLRFDDFVRWQIAGDEIAPENRLAMMATGFLAAGVHSTQITKNEVERHRYDELDDMLSTIGTSMLGLTIGCARCHDHKYDPIPQADYYRLLSAFTTTVRSEVELDFDPKGYAEALATFQQKHAPYEMAVADYERTVLPQRLQNWLTTDEAKSLSPDWIAPRAIRITSAAGATFVPQSDGSWLATGKSGNHDTYTITLRTKLPQIAAIRIEALSDVSLKNGGPGRADNGNFALSKIEAEGVDGLGLRVEDQTEGSRARNSAADPQLSTINSRPISFSSARATFEQLGLPVAAALDDNPGSAWAVDPQFGRHHAAVFDLNEPWKNPDASESEITVRLSFECNTRHSMGRIRVSLATAPNVPADNNQPFAEDILTVLKAPRESWTAEQLQQVLTWYRQRDAGWKELDDRRAAHAATAPKPDVKKVLVATEGLPAVTLHTQAEKEFLDETSFLNRGDPTKKAGAAELGVLQALSLSGDADPWAITPPSDVRTSFQRRALADWLTDVDRGAGALLARVAVNRLWQHHFGRGLVATASDFGRRGEPPSHPELLEWLAAELVHSGWDVKPLHRLIVTSQAYQQQVAIDPSQVAADPDNRWLTRWQPRRLEAEAIRDSLLTVSGLLDNRMFGPGTLDSMQLRRSLYFTVKRSQLVPMLTVFDAPDGTTGVPVRPETTVAPQALWQLNDALVRRAAQVLSQRITSQTSDPADQVRSLYRDVLGRMPEPEELDPCVEFLSTGDAALVDLCQTVLTLSEFVMVE